MTCSVDIRHAIFSEYMEKEITAVLVTEAPGVLSGIDRARNFLERLGVHLLSFLQDGNYVDRDKYILRISGNAFQIVKAEEQVIGALSKTSGIATAADKAQKISYRRLKIVSGGWKKMPIEIKGPIRQAVRDGGIDCRMSKGPFVYLDKNYVRILGGVKEAVEIGLKLAPEVVVQIKGETGPLEDEAFIAVQAGCTVIMVDTGRLEDLEKVIWTLKERGLRSKAKIAFAGNIFMDQLENLVKMDVDILDIGYAILDAPCLPMRFDVINVS